MILIATFKTFHISGKEDYTIDAITESDQVSLPPHHAKLSKHTVKRSKALKRQSVNHRKHKGGNTKTIEIKRKAHNQINTEKFK